MAKKKRSKRETIRGMAGHTELDPALWGLPEPPRALEEDVEPDEEPGEDGEAPDGDGPAENRDGTAG